jgi:hypothetical protein
VSDDIIVSGGGSVVVASDAILARVEKVARLSEDFRAGSAELVGLVGTNRTAAITPSRMPAAAAEAGRRIEDAIALLSATSRRAEVLYLALQTCLTMYGEGERVAAQASRDLSAQFAWLLGRVAPLVIVPLAADLVVTSGLVGLITGVTPQQQAKALGEYLGRSNGILTNPLIVTALRDTVMDVDDFGEGFIGVPPGTAQLLDRAGILGLPTSAAAIVAIANRFGLLEDSGVTVQRTSISALATPPQTLAERMARIPDTSSAGGDSRIRIDRYSTPGQPDSFDVYVAGTADFGLKAQGEPFDMTSNIVGEAQESPASYRAVLDAMQQAGVTSASPMMLTGYSQGGLVASLVAASGDYDVKGLVTFGSPSGQVPIPADVPTLTVRHAEDIVPATGGYDVNPQAVVVQRSLFDDQSIPPGDAVPAHDREYYAQTAALVDQAQSTEVRAKLDVLDSFGSGADGAQSTLWLAKRVPASSISSGR